ncbi:MAG: phospholipid carrier-dependent glycosyltransferase [Pseudomonadota bacterium]
MFMGHVRKHALWIIAVLSLLVGLIWRYSYVIVDHRATNYIYSDMKSYVDRALNFINPHYVETIADTVYPPGMHMLLGVLYVLDPSWNLAIWVQLILSCLIPLLVASIAYLLYGKNVAYLALILSSLYFGFIDYAGYFLAENAYTFCIVAAVLLLVISMRARSNVLWLIAALSAGVMLAVSASLKEAILVPAALVGLFLLYLAWERHSRKIFIMVIASCLGATVVLAPLSERCTTLSEGAFCVTSNNGALTMLLGHHGEVMTTEFYDNKRGYMHGFQPPPFVQLGYQGVQKFDFGAYDAESNRAAAWSWVAEHPIEAVLLSLRNVFQLFWGSVPWPSSHTDGKYMTIFFQQLFLLVVLIPVCVFVWNNAGALLRCDSKYCADIFILLPVIGLMAAVFLSLGDPRYRIPFDGFLMIIAARMYLGIDGKLSAVATSLARA